MIMDLQAKIKMVTFFLESQVITYCLYNTILLLLTPNDFFTGLPLLAATYCKQTNYEWISIFLIIMSIGGPVSHAIGLLKLNFVRSIGSTLSILSIMVFSLIFNKFGTNISGLGGSFLFILGGIVIGTEGTGILGVANVDWFHYVLSGAVLALANGIK